MQTCKNAGTLQGENLQMLWPALGSSWWKLVWTGCVRENKPERFLHRPAAAWASELLVSLAHCLAYSLLHAAATKANILIARELHGVSICRGSVLCYQLFPLQFFLWAPEYKTRSSKRVATAQMWNRNQTSTPQVHTVYKSCFSPSRRTCSNTIYK